MKYLLKKLTRLLQLLNIIRCFIILSVLWPTYKPAAAVRQLCFSTHNQILACGRVLFCYSYSFFFFFWELLHQTQTNRKNTVILIFFSWVSLFLCLTHPPTPPAIADSRPLLLLCCWGWLNVSAAAARGLFSRSHTWVAAPNPFLNPYHREAGLCAGFSLCAAFPTKENPVFSWLPVLVLCICFHPPSLLMCFYQALASPLHPGAAPGTLHPTTCPGPATQTLLFFFLLFCFFSRK